MIGSLTLIMILLWKDVPSQDLIPAVLKYC